MHGAASFGGMHAMGGRSSFASIGAGPRFAGPGFAGRGFSPRFSHAAFAHGFVHNRFFFHNRFRRFAFFGAPFAYADYGYYDSCWRTVWTPYGPQSANVCSGYGYF